LLAALFSDYTAKARAMANEGGDVPDWAVAFLHAIRAEREATAEQVEELKARPPFALRLTTTLA